jgi:hypothetical protein
METGSQPNINEQQPKTNEIKNKDEITPKIGYRASYIAYENTPLDPYERSKLSQEDFYNDRVERRMRMQEKAADKIDLGISNKDKFITRKGQEQFYFYGKLGNTGYQKNKEKYDEISKQNSGYKLVKEQEDKYFKNYVDNAKPYSLDQIDQDLYKEEVTKINKQNQYNKALNEQINTDRTIKKNIEQDYNKKMADSKKNADEKYQKQEKRKQEILMQNKNDLKNTNRQLIEQKKQAKKLDYQQNVDYENSINDKVKRQLDYIEEKEHRKKESKKIMYKQALDKQVNQNRIKKKRDYDIEHGNF